MLIVFVVYFFVDGMDFFSSRFLYIDFRELCCLFIIGGVFCLFVCGVLFIR